jgi:hypothetical protein
MDWWRCEVGSSPSQCNDSYIFRTFPSSASITTSIITTTSWIIFGGDCTMRVNCANKLIIGQRLRFHVSLFTWIWT